MRRLLFLCFLPALLAADPPAPAAPAEAPAGASLPRNASLNVTITYADGRTKAGKVTGIERTADFFGDEGWTQDEGKLKLTVEAGTTEKQVPWKDVKSLTITPGKMPDDVDCTYSSDFSPWMYDCTLRTTVAAVMKDGSKGSVTNRHRWRFVFNETEPVEFSVFKYSVRMQDEGAVEFGAEQGENFKLYTRLQDQLRGEMKTAVVKSITVQ
jgi:hypothetical protein